MDAQNHRQKDDVQKNHHDQQLIRHFERRTDQRVKVDQHRPQHEANGRQGEIGHRSRDTPLRRLDRLTARRKRGQK